MNRLRSLIQWLQYGGSRQLRRYERALLDQATIELGGSDGTLLATQLAHICWVQRQLQDRMVLFTFDVPRPEVPRLADQGEARCRVKMTLKLPAVRLTAAVVTHEGLLSSLEFSKPPRTLLNSEYQIVSVVLDARHRGPALAADRLEHGRS